MKEPHSEGTAHRLPPLACPAVLRRGSMSVDEPIQTTSQVTKVMHPCMSFGAGFGRLMGGRVIVVPWRRGGTFFFTVGVICHLR